MLVFAFSFFSSKTTVPVVHRSSLTHLFSAIVSIFLAGLLQANAGELFKFIQFSDLRLGCGKHDSAGCLELAKRAGELNENVEFVVVTGDIIDKGFKVIQHEDLKFFNEFRKSSGALPIAYLAIMISPPIRSMRKRPCISPMALMSISIRSKVSYLQRLSNDSLLRAPSDEMVPAY